MRISFYLDCKSIPNIVNFEELIIANPGIGGTEYAILTIAYLLSLKKEQYQISLYTTSNNTFAEKFEICHIKDLIDAAEQAAINKDDFLIFRHAPYPNLDKLAAIKTTTKYIVWCHNFASKKWLNQYIKIPNLGRIINVGQEELDLYRDHKAYQYSDYIYNGVFIDDIKKYKNIPQYSSRKNIVTYIGNLKQEKGFHVLAKAWKDVLKEIPDAELNVIGSAQLYDRNVKLGKYGIATEEYEKIFIPYLLDENNQILKSVHFLGIMGKEKMEILFKTKVGIPNPSGVSETFGYTAVEMQLHGCLITTKKCAGYIDTVAPTGILFDNEKELPKNIVKLLKQEDNNLTETIFLLNKKFSFNVILPKWEQLFYNIQNGKGRLHPISKNNLMYELKWLKEVNRRIKNVLPFGYFLLPTVGDIQLLLQRCMSFIKRLFIML